MFSESSPVSGGGGSHGSTVVPDATYSKIILYCERIDFNAPQNLIAEVTVAPDQTVGVPEGKKIVLNNVTTSGYSQLLPPGLILHTIVIP